MLNELTPRQYELFTLIGKGLTDEEVAEKMCIKANTLRTRKLELREILETTGILTPRKNCHDFQTFYDFAKRYVESRGE